jgi:RNA binding exosome subunit
MNWAISLILSETESIENRLHGVVAHIISQMEVAEILVTDIDATGVLGNQLTIVLNEQNSISITLKDLLAMLTEDGQIFDLDLHLRSLCEYRFIISDGNFLDILGTAEKLPLSVTGPNEYLLF